MELAQRQAPSVLVVDDERSAARVIGRILEDRGYSCELVHDVASAESAMERHAHPIVVTDMDMPGGSGLDLIAFLSARHPDTAVVMLTGHGSTGTGIKAIEAGAFSYLTKPIARDDLLVNVANASRRRELEIENRTHRERLESLVEERTAVLSATKDDLERSEQELRVSREETIRRLAIAAELRDNETGRHVDRMSHYAAVLGSCVLDSQATEELRLASLLHDVGKIGIPDEILRKPGPLTRDQFDVMMTHTDLGRRILADSESTVLRLAASIAHAHHEWFDGSGYPSGFRGEEIPFEGRIAAIADVFDALTTDRIYRPRFSVSEAVEMMRAERGSHFDPRLLDLFLDRLPEVLRTGNRVLGS